MKHRTDLVKDRKDVGVVEFPIEKLMEFWHDASDFCYHSVANPAPPMSVMGLGCVETLVELSV